MTDINDLDALKRIAQADVGLVYHYAFREAFSPDVALELIAEIERLRGECDEARQEARANVMAADRAEAERDADVGNYRVVNAAIERDTAEHIATWLENRASAVDWVNANETATAIRAGSWKRGVK